MLLINQNKSLPLRVIPLCAMLFIHFPPVSNVLQGRVHDHCEEFNYSELVDYEELRKQLPLLSEPRPGPVPRYRSWAQQLCDDG